MTQKLGSLVVSLLILALLLMLPNPVFSASVPRTTQEMLKKLQLDPSILKGLEQELQVPPDWMERARVEGKVTVQGTPGAASVQKDLFAPFRERYPFITLEYNGLGNEERVVKTLMAYKSGRVIADVVESVAGGLTTYKEAKALEDLRNIPGMKNIIDNAKGTDGLHVQPFMNYWCISYNTKLVKKEDLPRKWEDLLVNSTWRGGNLALGNRPTQWVLQLWKIKGESWVKDFLNKLFTEVKPQLRREGSNALPQLVGAGEFYAVVPSDHTHAYDMASQGAPVGFVCPEPGPFTSISGAFILKGAPNIYAARLYMNWMLSKEGQIARYLVSNNTPVHKELQRKEFVPFPEEILAKEATSTDPSFDQVVVPKLNEYWNNLWLRGGSGRQK